MTALTATKPGLRLDDVTLLLGDGDGRVSALDHVELTVDHGELLAIAGPSGCGKSSLLAVAGGLIRPTSGRVEIGGTDLTALPDRRRTAFRHAHIGYVFQSANLLPALTALEQLLLVPKLAGRITPSHRDHARRLLAAAGVQHRADRRPHQLSGGERQRVAIARALMAEPEVLLADEPTSALDHRRAREIVALLALQAHQRTTAAVVVTHDPGVLDLADRVVAMQDGRLQPLP
jgi:putative ABC transport system ATP-binding protein